MYLHVRVTNQAYADSIGDTTAVRHAFTTSVFGWRLVALIDIVAVVLFARRARHRHRRESSARQPRPRKEL